MIEEAEQLRKSARLATSILSKCVDNDNNKLPNGVGFRHFYQIKMNSYVNTMKDIVSLNLYFKGHKDISNAKYYTIDNLSVDKFHQCRDAIFAVNSALHDVFSEEYDVDLSYETGMNKDVKSSSKSKADIARQLALLK